MALEAGVISLSVDYAKGLSNMDWFGKQDPYCIIRVGSQTFRTRTAKDGGINPVWGEKFTISLMNENDATIDIKDEDVGRDDFIGSASFSLARARQMGHDHLEVPVFGAKSRKQHGYIAVTLKWTPHRAPLATHPYAQPQWPAIQHGGAPLPSGYAVGPPWQGAAAGADGSMPQPPAAYGYAAPPYPSQYTTGPVPFQPPPFTTAYQ